MLSDRNIPLFVAFRVFFNARWYYPVLTILFLDLGLTLEQYALLNVAWAASIVCLEVPLGAIADQMGRRRMVVLAAGLMVAEMLCFAFAPTGSSWLFPLLLLNRVLSGAAEACASGADESLVYDSLAQDGRSKEWPTVLARVMRWQSAAFFVTMLIGAAVYDSELMSRILAVVGASGVSPQTTVRWPLYLTLLNAAGAFVAAIAMREPARATPAAAFSVLATWRQSLTAARWTFSAPVVLFALLAGVSIDCVIRLFLTMCSNYYRLISLPEAFYGAIASAFAVLGFFTPGVSQWLVETRSMAASFAVAAALAMSGLLFAALFVPFWGLLAVVPLGVGMSMVPFFLSHYLNVSITDSSMRATVLSFKGVCINLAYGSIGLLFAGYTRWRQDAGTPDSLFIEAMRGIPLVFAVLCAALVVLAYRSKATRVRP